MGSRQKISNFFKKKFTCKFSIDYCNQSSSDNVYLKLLTSKTEKTAEKSDRYNVYYGIGETIFELRYMNYSKYFNQKYNRRNTDLSNEYCRIKDKTIK